MAKKAGLKVNESKTEACLFHRSLDITVTLYIKGSNINVLGILFDSKLQWNDQVAHAINKSNLALHCIRLIKYHFTPEELKQIITSNFYSILYYNSEIWNKPELKCDLKKRLLSASANALKLYSPSYHDRMSYSKLHKINKRATPH